MAPLQTASGAFCTTHWTVILEAARPEGLANGAFAQLYLDYWRPVYAFVRRRGFAPEQAEDITQDFFVRIVEKRSLSGVEQEGGRFRSFLLRSLQNFLANDWDRSHAQKRGGGQRMLSLNAEDGEACFALAHPDQETPEASFEKRWVFTLLDHVCERLRQEYASAGKAGLFDQLRPHLLGDRSGQPYAVVAAQCGMTESAVKVAAHRMRKRYGEILRDEIARTVSSMAEVDEELQHLMAVVGQ